jgi:hypothetical protein
MTAKTRAGEETCYTKETKPVSASRAEFALLRQNLISVKTLIISDLWA